MKFLFTISATGTSAIEEVAKTTPLIGETVLPNDAARFIGSIMLMLLTPNFAAIFGIKGPNEKNAALRFSVYNRLDQKIVAALINGAREITDDKAKNQLIADLLLTQQQFQPQ